MAQVELRGVNKSFGKTEVIRNVELEINKGEFVVFVGPSGCGKSTLLRLISGLENLSSGDIVIADNIVSELPPSKRGIAMVFQSYALYPHMTVFHNMAFSLDLQGIGKKEIKERVEAAAKILQMEELLDRRPAALSGGQRQRVAIGRAIVRNPDVFLFDEPLSNLDAALRHDTRVEIARLHSQLGATTIYVTHDQVEAMTLADKIVVLRDGEVMQVGSPMELFNFPKNEFVAGFLGAPKINLIEKPHESSSAAHRQLWSVLTQHLTREPHTIGIRPEQCKVSHTPNGVQASVTLAEHLGDSSILYLKIEGLQSLFNLKLDANASKVQNGDSLFISAEPQHVLAFDAAGQNMDLQ